MSHDLRLAWRFLTSTDISSPLELSSFQFIQREIPYYFVKRDGEVQGADCRLLHAFYRTEFRPYDITWLISLLAFSSVRGNLALRFPRATVEPGAAEPRTLGRSPAGRPCACAWSAVTGRCVAASRRRRGCCTTCAACSAAAPPAARKRSSSCRVSTAPHAS